MHAFPSWEQDTPTSRGRIINRPQTPPLLYIVTTDKGVFIALQSSDSIAQDQQLTDSDCQ